MPTQTNTSSQYDNLRLIAALEHEIHELKQQIKIKKSSDKHELKRKIAAQKDDEKKALKKHHRSQLLKDLQAALEEKTKALNKLIQPLQNDLNSLANLCETYLIHLNKSIDKTLANLAHSAQAAFLLNLANSPTKSSLKITYPLKTEDGKIVNIPYLSLIEFRQLNNEPLPNPSLLHKLNLVAELLTEINSLQETWGQKHTSALRALTLIQNIQTKTQDDHEFKKSLSAHRDQASLFFRIPDKYSTGGKFIRQLKTLASKYPDANSYHYSDKPSV